MSEKHHKRYDPLLECLVIFSRHYYQPVSIESLISGLPIEPGKTSPELFSIKKSRGLFSRVAHRAGFTTRLVKSELDEFSQLLLPAIIVLKNHQACILEEIDVENRKAKIIVPDLPNSEQWVDLEKLDKEYLGYAFLLKKVYKYKKRQDVLLDAKKGHWFWATLKRSTGIYSNVIIASVIINLFVLATPLFTRNVYDRVVPNNAVETLWVLSIAVLIVYAFDSVLKFIRNYLLEIAGKKSDVIMSSIIFEHVLNMRYESWPSRIGSFASNLREFESIRNFFTSSTLVALVDLPFAVIFIVVIAYIGGSLVWIPITTSLMIVLYGLMIRKPLRESIESTYEASANKNSHLIESLNSIQTLKTLGAFHVSQWIWEESTGEIAQKSMKSRLLSSSMMVVTNLIMQANTIALIIFGVYMIKDLELTMGSLIAVTMLSSRVIAPMGQVAGLITSYEQTRTAYEHLDEIMNREVERPHDKEFIVREDYSGEILLKNIAFQYPQADKETLSGINLHISPGEKVAIIGKVGSGKSTLAKLLIGLYKPTEGSIFYDEIDMSQIDPANLREFVSYLSQDVELIKGSIKDNIVLKDSSVNYDLLIHAAKIGGVDLFVNQLEMGYDTQVGEKGLLLSGGQRQSIAIARSCLLDEPILILDEPTNSFDNTTESIIRKRLYDYTRDKTLILITHKAPMLDLVDRIIVIDNGRIVMDGEKEQVLKALQGQQNG